MAEITTSKKQSNKPARSAAPQTVQAPFASAEAMAEPTIELPSIALVADALALPVATVAAGEHVHIETPAAATAVAQTEDDTMTETFNQVQDTAINNAEDATAKASAFFNDANGHAKDAVAKGTKAIEEIVEFSKGNLEALAASGRVAAKGAEEIAKYSAEYGRTSIEKANATAKQFAAVKSPTEFFQLQGDIAKQMLDSLVAEGAKFTESYLKLLGEIAQPISNRYAVAAEKVKTTVAQ